MKIRLKLASLVLLLFVLTNCIKENECCCSQDYKSWDSNSATQQTKAYISKQSSLQTPCWLFLFLMTKEHSFPK